MTARLAPSLVLALLLLAPGASALAARHDPVELDYEATKAPVVLGAGALDLSGDLRDAVLVANASPLTLTNVPTLRADASNASGGSPAETTFSAATLRVESGSVLWRLGDAAAGAHVTAAYGLGLALTEAPLPTGDNGTPGAGALVAGPSVSTSADWAGGETQLVVLDGVVTLLRADGVPFPGWTHRAVNPDATGPGDAGAAGLLFRTDGAFVLRAESTLVAGAVGSSANLTLAVHRADRDRFADTVAALSDLGAKAGLNGGKDSPFAPDGPLQNLAPLSGVLNGALLVIGGGNDTAAPLASRIGQDPLDAAPFAVMRSGDMRVAWSGSQMRVQGSPAVLVSKNGFAVSPTASVAGVVPVVSVVLWVGALAAIVVFLVKRPEKTKTTWTIRLASWLAYLVVLVVVFLIWDASFADTFGTSVVTLLKAGSRDPQQLGVTFGLETAPWSLAALLFALPVRIMLGVALRYVAKGRPLSSVAKAGGLVALAILGPLYALWIVNVVIERVVAAMAK
jgi:hypothetical protein